MHDFRYGPAVTEHQRIEFFFDPMCPWAYQTSVWIRRVRDQRPLELPLRLIVPIGIWVERHSRLLEIVELVGDAAIKDGLA